MSDFEHFAICFRMIHDMFVFALRMRVSFALLYCGVTGTWLTGSFPKPVPTLRHE